MNAAKLSLSTRIMMSEDSRIGYRDDSTYNSGVTNFVDIINYEINELYNDDILFTMMNVYDVFINTYKSIEYNISVIVDTVKELLGIIGDEPIYAIWLCSNKEQVRSIYDGHNISKYKINDDAIVVSDLGKEGALICSKFPFNK